MQTPWLNGVVADYVTFKFTPYPLPYHIFSLQVAQIVPYLMDLCLGDSTQCLMDDYRNFCYANYSNVLAQTNMSLDAFIPWWTAQVAQALNLDQATLESLYGPDDIYNTQMSTRELWKFGSTNGVFTPMVAVPVSEPVSATPAARPLPGPGKLLPLTCEPAWNTAGESCSG